jgi:deoxyuridine 5'-triphosphate nucleotidohydrolase
MSLDIPTLNFVIIDQTLHEIYKQRVEEHNRMVVNDKHPNSGFDLLIPNSVTVDYSGSLLVDMGVKACMFSLDGNNIAYQIFPRSSISKTPIILSNHVGIIDSGYRGNLMAAFRIVDPSYRTYEIEKNTRLVQICLPTLEPFRVNIVDESQLSQTSRGSGGFGSTGV